jgi:CrcB protein
MGLLIGWFALKTDPGQTWRLFLTTGILGGFTTFSAFSLEVVLLYRRGETGMAVFYVLASVAVSLAALFLGMLVARHFR